MSLNTSDILEIILSSTRTKPLRDKIRTYGLDFKYLDPEEDSKLMSIMYKRTKELNDHYKGRLNSKELAIVTHIAEDVALGGYLMNQQGLNKYMQLLLREIVEQNVKNMGSFVSEKLQAIVKTTEFEFLMLKTASLGYILSKESQAYEDHIYDQYNKRIEYLLKSNKSEEDKATEKEILENNATFDPRHKSVWFGSHNVASNSMDIINKLNALTDEEFLTSPYVLSWGEDLWGEEENKVLLLTV